MKKTRSTFALLAAATMLFTAALTGCGSKDSNEDAGAGATEGSSGTASASASASTASDGGTDAKLEPVTLRWVLPKVQTQNESQPVFDAANKIIQEKINATVKFDMIDLGDYEKKISLMLAAGEEADLFFTSNWLNNYYQNVAKGGLTDLTDMLATSAPNLKGKFSASVWDALKVSGKIYGVPNQSVFVRRMGLQFRKDLVEKYGFDYNAVKTLQDVEPFLQTIKEKEPDVIPIENTGSDNGAALYQNMRNVFGWDTMVSMTVPGAGRDNGELKVFNQFESQEFKDYLKLVRDWYNKGYIQKDAATTKENYRAQGKFAVVSDPAAYPGEDVIYSMSQAGGIPYVLNSTMDGDSALQTGSIASNMSAVSKTSKNPERALMLLDLVNSDPELFNLLAWGIEGTNYTKQADGTIEQIKDGKYEGIYNFFLGDMLQTYITKGQPLDMYDQMRKLNASGTPSVFLGFVFDSEPVKSQIAQCTAVVTQYLNGLTSGSLDPDKYYPEFIDKLKKAGSDKIIAEMQKQVDEWAKSK